MTAPARFDLKLDNFVRAAAKEKARSVIDQESRLMLTRRDFKAFRTALDRAFTPSEPLQEALDSSRQTVRRA